MKKNLFLLGIAAMALASCSHSEYDGPDMAGGKLVVTGSVQQIISRASGAAWDAGDQIGVSSSAGQDNVLFVTESGDGVFTSSVPVYVLGDGEKTFTAYYPYDESVNTDVPTINFTTPKDYMWATTTATRENPRANFVFAHKMSKISFVISDDTQASSPAGSTIKIDGVAVEGSFNTLTGVVTASSTKSNLTSGFVLDRAAEFIVPVQDVNGSVAVMLDYNGKTYAGSIQLTSLAAGTEYHYTINLAGQDPAAELAISSATITDWNKTDGGEINVEETETPKEDNVLEVGDFLLKDGTVIDKNDRDFNELKNQIAGVVFYVGNPQPSALYGYNSAIDVLKADYPTCTNGLAIAINDANDGAPARFASAKYSFADVFKETASNYDADLAAQYISTNMNLTAPGERMLGYNNTKFVQACAQKFGDDSSATGVADFLTLLQAYNTANAVTNASSWYMPSLAELNAVIENYAAVKAGVEKAGGSLPSYSEFGTTNTQTFYWSSDFRGNSYNWVSPMMTVADGVNLFLGRNSNGTQGFFRLTTAF